MSHESSETVGRADLSGYRRLLIFGGSFDPPHRAHVELPEAVRVAIDADVIVYVPAGRAPHKLDKQQTAGTHRLAMLRLAVGNAVAAGTAVVLDDEIRRVEEDGRPSYTINTLEDLKRRIHPDAEMRLLIGMDQVRIFESWKDWGRIVELAEPVVMMRPPETLAKVPDHWRPRVVEVPAIDLSSSEVRRRVAAGESLGQRVAADVAIYIGREGLYRPPLDAAGGASQLPISFGEAWFGFTHSGAKPTARDRQRLVSGRKVFVVFAVIIGLPVFMVLSLFLWMIVGVVFG